MFMFNDYCDSLELYARGLAQHCLRDRGKPANMRPHVHDVAYVSIWFCKRSRGVFTKLLPLHVFGGISWTLCRQGALDGGGDGDTERDGVEWGGDGGNLGYIISQGTVRRSVVGF